jgi:hypothetical protein
MSKGYSFCMSEFMGVVWYGFCEGLYTRGYADERGVVWREYETVGWEAMVVQ